MELSGQPVTSSRGLMKLCSTGAVICAVLIFAAIAVQAVSGGILAASSRQDCPQSEAVRDDAINTYATLSSLHKTVGHVALVVVLFMTACAILFSLHVTGFISKHCNHPWRVTAVAVLSAVLVFIVVYQGGNYHSDKLESRGFWLTPPAGGFPDGTEIAEQQVVSSSTFLTFIALHGIVLPFAVIVLIMFIWPCFYEFLKEDGPESRSKWSDISQGRA